METATQKTDGSPNPMPENVGNGETASKESEPLLKNVCPTCGSIALVFGSRDPAEGDYYWCEACGQGPILFSPFFTETPKANAARYAEINRLRISRRPGSFLDAETAQAAMGIRGRAAAVQRTMFADREPFDTQQFVDECGGLQIPTRGGKKNFFQQARGTLRHQGTAAHTRSE